jgi:erythromycin esterase
MKFFTLLAFFTLSISFAQNPDVLAWINSNAITIEDANPDNPPTIFAQNVPQKCKDARIFGFGEASHHGKEFFDLKAKFFKYLVEQKGVTLFIMEESYQAEKGINGWISGGAGDAATILNNFNQGVWYTNEVKALLQWMRDYNRGKPREKQIRFYGMDNQFGKDINVRLREYVTKNAISIDENLLKAVDSCSVAELKAGGIKKWADAMLPKLKKVRGILESNKERFTAASTSDYNDMLRALSYLEQYTAFLQNPYSQYRDRDMYNNVVKIIELEGANSKAFIWAHNEHINKKNLYGSNRLQSLGSRLKEHFKDAYYSVGFDFGNGVMKGYEFKDGQITGYVHHTLNKPYKDTFAETLFLAQPDIYFIDMASVQNNVAAKFFGTKMKQLMLGGPGFDPKKQTFYSRKYSEAYDGLIFVKTISPATY